MDVPSTPPPPPGECFLINTERIITYVLPWWIGSSSSVSESVFYGFTSVIVP